METKLLLEVLVEGLKLWNHERASYYLNKTIKLKKEYYEELQKPTGVRSDLHLDQLLDELNIIASTFVKFRAKEDSNSSGPIS